MTNAMDVEPTRRRPPVFILVTMVLLPVSVLVWLMLEDDRQNTPRERTFADDVDAILATRGTPHGETWTPRFVFQKGNSWTVTTNVRLQLEEGESLPAGFSADRFRRCAGLYRFDVTVAGPESSVIVVERILSAEADDTARSFEFRWFANGALRAAESDGGNGDATPGDADDVALRRAFFDWSAIVLAPHVASPCRLDDAPVQPTTPLWPSLRAREVEERLGVTISPDWVDRRGGVFLAAKDGAADLTFRGAFYGRAAAAGEIWAGRYEAAWTAKFIAPETRPWCSSGEWRLRESFALERSNTIKATAASSLIVSQSVAGP